jgi:cellulose synthase/poly-beta-1,6-N-acetylglucosamine synthase-like glycosyltransferase
MMNPYGVVFWGSLGLSAYAYAGYPLILAAWARMKSSPTTPFGVTGRDPLPLPRVSLIIPAYNEEQVIARKIRNTLELDYPRELLEIVVVSDGSSDATERLARETAGDRARLVFFQDRQGKTACINAVLAGLLGKIIVFTDANAYFHADALVELVLPFRDPRIGCVMGELRYAQKDSLNSALGEGLYWRYENFIKDRESRLGSTIVGNGAIYALRRELCRELPREVEADVANPLLALSAGFRVIFRRQARCWERPAQTVKEEFHRKTRIITNQITSYLHGWRFLRPLPAGAMFQILSHKVMRWLVPFFLAGMLAGSAVSRGDRLLDAVLALQVLFYSAALAGWALESGKRPVPRLLFLPYYFCAVNLASIRGMADFALGRRRVVWEKAPSTRS